MENENIAGEPMVPYSQPLDFQQVWLMFQETDRQLKETDRQLKETDRILTEKFQETDRILTERFQETDRILTERFQETDRMLSTKFSETDKKIRKLDQLFTSQWGKLVESLVEGDLVKLLNTKGIAVQRTVQRADGNYQGQNFEFDIIAINGAEIVIVEVKTTLRPQDVTDFHKKLWKAKTYLPEYHDKKIYGAVAFVTVEGSSHRMAEKQGLFVIRATGSSSSIVNREDFKPQAF